MRYQGTFAEHLEDQGGGRVLRNFGSFYEDVAQSQVAVDEKFRA